MTREQQNKAQDLIRNSQWQQAIDVLVPARQEEPENPWLLGSLAYCHSRLKQYKEALALYEHLCQVEPAVARWPYSVGYQYYGQQEWAKAIEYFDQALTMEPDYIVVLYRKGYALSRLEGKQAEALTVFERCRRAYQALTGDEEKDRERGSYGGACFQQGKLFLDGGKAQLAEERLREAATLTPDEADVHYNLGKAYLALSRWDDAMTSLRTAQRLSPQPQHYVLDAIAQAYTGAGQPGEAIKVYEQMDAGTRGRPYILRNMGTVYTKLEQYEQAERTLEEAVRKEPGNHNGHYRLGRVYEQREKWAEAAREYKAACDLRQRNYNVPFAEAEQALATLLSEHPEANAAPPPRPPVTPRPAYAPRQATPSGPAQAPRQDAPPAATSARAVGRVKTFFADKGFGFIEVGGGQPDVFFHVSQVQGGQSVQVGDQVQYSVGQGKRGPAALDVQVVASPSQGGKS